MVSPRVLPHPLPQRARPGNGRLAWLVPVLGIALTGTPGTLCAQAQGTATSAAPAPAATAQAATAPPAVEPSSADAYGAFRREFDAGRYVEATAEARKVLALAEAQTTTPAAEDVQVALMNLGMAQNLAEDYLGAEATYKRAIKLIESSGRPLHARLARAYAGLATSYHDTQRHELAVQAFDQAIALTRRHEGLLTDRQVPLVEKYIDSLTELGRYEEGLQAQKYLLRIALREYGDSSVQLVPRLEEIGRWYTKVGAYDQSRRILKQAIDIVETAEGANSQRLVGPLLALANTNRRQLLDPVQQPGNDADSRAARFNDPTMPLGPSGYSAGMMLAEGEKSLQRAAALTDALPSPPPGQVVNVRTQLGDWYQLRQQPERALESYHLAWAAASRIPPKANGKPTTELVFGQPLLLEVVRPEGWNRNAGKPVDTIEVRTVSIEATVGSNGRVEDAKVVDDSGDARRAERTLKTYRDTARYRPRFENGEPVATTGVRFEQPFILLLKPEEPEKPAGTKPPETPPPATTAPPAPAAADAKTAG